MKARGYYTKSTRVALYIVPIVQELQNNNFKNIKILKPDEFENHPKAIKLRQKQAKKSNENASC